MPNRILTSHAGSLPRPETLIRLNERRAAATAEPAAEQAADERAYQEALRTAVTDVVKRQRDTGIDLVNDGEYGHSMGQRYDYGSWWTYVFQRLGGLELAEFDIAQIAQAKARPGEITLASFGQRRDWQRFAEAYGDPSSGASLPNRDAMPMAPVCRGPITYTGQRGGPARHRRPQGGDGGRRRAGRLPELGRARQLRPVRQRVLRQRRRTCCRRARTPCARSTWRSSTRGWACSSMTPPSPRTGTRSTRPRASRTTSGSRWRGWTRSTGPIRGLPTDRIRFHLCWGSWHGPHTTDLPMADIVD